MTVNPTLIGSASAETLIGATADTTLIGYGGNDHLTGSAGNDTLVGDSPFPVADAGILGLVAHAPAFSNWAIDYSAQTDTNALVQATQDMLVIGAARVSNTGQLSSETLWTPTEIAAIEGSGKEVYGYLDLNKINTYTTMWNAGWNSSVAAPSWLGAIDPLDKTGQTYLVNFVSTPAGQTVPVLDPDWEAAVLARAATIAGQGFTGLFLDDPGEYFWRNVPVDPMDPTNWSYPPRLAAIAENARAMRDLVLAIHTAQPALKLIVNGAPYLPGDTTADGATGQQSANDAYGAAVSALVAEDYIAVPDTFAQDGAKAFSATYNRPILSLDYSQPSVPGAVAPPLTAAQRLQYTTQALSLGFLPSVPDNGFTLPPNFLTTLHDANAGSHNDTMDGGAGINTATYAGLESDYVLTRHGGVVTVVDTRVGSPDGTDTLTNIQTLTFANATISTAALPCFAGGTRIATARGEIAVERLRVGDIALTASGGRMAVRWLGHRRLDCRRHARPWDVHPVRVLRDAFAPGQPRRDLLLSPDHALLAGGVLIPVRYLINGATIRQEPVGVITYWHVELERHDVVLAEGLAAESYLDTGNRHAFVEGGDAIMLHPDFARQAWQARGCAELVMDGRRLLDVRAALLRRALRLGFRTSADTALTLRALGTTVMPRIGAGGMMHFDLPAGTRRVRLCSRSAVPGQVRVNDRDHRRLGVAVAYLALDGSAVPLGSPKLRGGWWDAEDGLRWTDGDAVIVTGGADSLTLRALPLLRYWTPPLAAASASAAS